ncbi:hypothetical protein ACFQ2B_27700 [Streptomyces stramineus]|uniref:Uncharacterized protein n=1 Tax=Streptomyces stramineus TaxID=173861 RepID=A0ABP3JK92_9ACTN
MTAMRWSEPCLWDDEPPPEGWWLEEPEPQGRGVEAVVVVGGVL